MKIDRERVDAALKALRQCNEIEAACAIYTFETEVAEGKRGRPRGSKNRPKGDRPGLLVPPGHSSNCALRDGNPCDCGVL